MNDSPDRKPKIQISIPHIVFYLGLALVIFGYVLLCISPQEEMQKAIDHAFTGMGLVVFGAVLCLAGFAFKE